MRLIKLEGKNNIYYIMSLEVGMSLLTTFSFFSNRLDYQAFIETFYRGVYCFHSNVDYLSNVFAGNGVAAGMFMAMLFTFYHTFHTRCTHKKKRINKGAFFLGNVFGMIMLFGTSMEKMGNFDFVFASALSVCLAGFVYAGYAYFFYIVAYCLLVLIIEKKGGECRKTRIAMLIFDSHPVLSPMAIVGICWLPYLIAFFPGTVAWDGLRQVDFYIGRLPWTKFHPVVSTWLMGRAVTLGKEIFNSDNMGVFLYTGVQVICFLLCIGYGMKLLKKWNMPYWQRGIILGFFGLVPMWSSYAYTLIKDTSYMLVMFMYQMLFLEYMYERKNYPWYKWLALALASFGVCALRNNGIHVSILAFPFMVAYAKGQRRKMAAVMGSVIIVFLLLNEILFPQLGIADGENVQEALSIPFQQTARYVKYYGDEVTEEERNVISKVLLYETLSVDYNPQLSDPVKFGYGVLNKDNTNLPAYFRVWFQQLLKHPGVYVEATAANTYGYFYPITFLREVGYFHHALGDSYVDYGDFDFAMWEKTHGWRKGIEFYLYLLARTPIIGLFLTTAFWDWLLLGSSVLLVVVHRKSLLVATVPMWLTFLVCLAGPVNAYVRYMIPNMIIIPFFIGWIWYMMKDETGHNGHPIKRLG